MKNKVNKIRIRIIISFIVILSIMHGCFNFFINYQIYQEKMNATYTAESTVRKIETQLGRYLETSNILKNIIEDQGEISDDNFNNLARYMKKNEKVVEAFELAPAGIVSQVYPYKSNEEVVGMNMLELAERKTEAKLAKKSGEYTIAGPYELKQGGKGALLFDPIYVDDGQEKKFWGFSILVLNWNNFLQEANVKKLSDASYHYNVWKENKDGKKSIIMSCAHKKLKDTLSVSCTVPNDLWHFEIVPFDGWIPMYYKLGGFVLCVLITYLITVVYWQSKTKRLKEEMYAKEIAESAKKAQEANEAKTKFLFNMSHDIRTPMNAIIGYSDLLEDNLDDKDKALNYISKIKSSNSVLLSLINYILEMAAIESGKMSLKEENEDLNDLIDSIIDVARPHIQKKNLYFTYEPHFQQAKIICDKTRFREVILNILINAIKYTPEGGSVYFKVDEYEKQQEDHVTYCFTIKDTGIGMKKDYLPHIFEVFSRERTSTESKVPGVGLGLPIVKSIVDMMKGAIHVESELNKGTTFKVDLTFPIYNAVTVIENKEEKNILNFKGKHILLVEDNELNAEIGMEILKTFDLDIDLASNGKECLTVLENKPEKYYDVILMDVQMPVMNGYEATKAIRQLNNGNATIPIIAMTANAFEEDRQVAFKAGMNEHIAKPIDVEKLFAVLSKYLNQ